MHQIDIFTHAGLRAAAMSDLRDGDCVLGASSAANRRAFLHGLGLDPTRLVCPRQVHGVAVVSAMPQDAGRGAFCARDALALADGISTNVPGLPIGITVADCVPVAFFDPVRRVVALAHAGREGTRHNIAAHTVAHLRTRYGCAPQNLRAYIGPSAGPCCYEVSQELADDFAAAGLPTRGRYLDLWEANRQQLLTAGVADSQIDIARHCTLCMPGYFSFRAQKTPARNLMVLSL